MACVIFLALQRLSSLRFEKSQENAHKIPHQATDAVLLFSEDFRLNARKCEGVENLASKEIETVRNKKSKKGRERFALRPL